jgi:hypothetical protein
MAGAFFCRRCRLHRNRPALAELCDGVLGHLQYIIEAALSAPAASEARPSQIAGASSPAAILEHFPISVNRRDSQRAANKILWSPQTEEAGNGVFERFTSSSDPGC